MKPTILRRYFKKSKEKQEEIYSQAFFEIIEYQAQSGLAIPVIRQQLEELESLACRKENYELAEIVKKLNDELKTLVPNGM